MRLTDASMQRFKSVEASHFRVDAMNVLVGPNNCGKSSIIQAMHFAFTTMQSLNISNKWPGANKKSVTISPNELVYLPSNDPYFLGMGGQLREDRERAIDIGFTFEDGQEATMVFRKGRITNVLVEPTNADYARTLSTLKNPYSVYSPGLAGIARSENYVSDGILLRALARGDANAFLRNILYRLLQEPRKWSNFESDLSSIFPETKIKVTYDDNIDEYIDVQVTQNAYAIPLDLSGTGLLQGIHILSYYHLFLPKLILLDEPDSHLHPNNQRLLCSLLSSLSANHDVSIVMTTHSRHVIDALTDEASFYWVESGNATPVAQDEQLSLLLDLGALDIRERIRAPNTRAIVLTEDKKARSLEVVLGKSNFNVEETLILSYKGVTSVHLLEPLIRQIQSHCDATIIVHRDRDFLDPDEVETWKVQVRALNAAPFVTQFTDVDEYFVSESVLTNLRMPVPGFDYNSSTQNMVEHFREEAVRDFVNGRIDIERKKGNAARIDHGQLAVRANQMFRERSTELIKGKKKRSWYRQHFQEQYDTRLEDVINNSLVRDEELSIVGRRIFGNLAQDH